MNFALAIASVTEGPWPRREGDSKRLGGQQSYLVR